MGATVLSLTALITGYLLDATLGDPACLPHPIVGFGKLIGRFEMKLNKGSYRFLKGAFMSVMLVGSTFTFTSYLLTL